MRSRPLPLVNAVVFAVALTGCQSAPLADDGTGWPEPAGCPGNWYASVDIYVDGQRISYNHPDFTLEGGQGRDAHLHRGNDWKWHYQMVDGLAAAERCMPFADVLGQVGTKVSPGRLVLDGTHAEMGQAGTFTAGGGAALVARHRLPGTDWAPLAVHRLVDRQLADGEHVLLAFGSADAADWPAWQATADRRNLQPHSA